MIGVSVATVADLQRDGILLVEDGNHGEYRPRPDEFIQEGVAFIRAADMNNGLIDFAAASRINDRAAKRITKGIGRSGDVLLSHKGTVGKIARAPQNAPPFVCSPQTTFWRTLDEDRLDGRYLHVLMRSPFFSAQLASRAGETDMAPYVSLTAQRSFKLLVPELPRQHAIADIISTLDDKIELNRRMNETLEASARALFRDWFVDFGPTRAKAEGRRAYLAPDLWSLFPDRVGDDGVPEGWEWETLGKNAINYDSKRVPVSGADRAKRQGSYPYHGATSVMDHVDSYLFDGTFVLVGEDGSVVREDGRAFTQFVSGKIWVNNHAHVLQGKDPVSTEHIYLFFENSEVRPFITGAVQLKLSQGRMNAMPFIQPGPALCVAFSTAISPMFEKLKTNQLESRTIAATRDALLPKLMSGELRVRDAEALAA